MEAWMKRTADFAVGLIISEKKNPSVVPYRPAKAELMEFSRRSLGRSTPARLGVSSGRLLQLINELEEEPGASVHSLIVAKGSDVVLECSAPGYSVNMPHLSHSMSKVLTALAVGLAVDDGKLTCDTPVYELLREYSPRERSFYDITVHHLLTMSSGVRFSEAGVVSDDEWCRTFFESSVSFAPGSKFEYNSMNTYVLAKIVKKLYGRGLSELLRERILGPLGIREFFWESSPEGCEKGGFGVFMSLEDWVKIAILVKGGGVYNGSRIISREWIDKCTKKQIETPKSEGRYSYGYQTWVSDDGNILFSGMLGQSVLINPKKDIIIAVNSGNNELFQSGDAFAVIDRAMSRGFSREWSESYILTSVLKHRKESFFSKKAWITPERKKGGLLSRIGLSFRAQPPAEWSTLLGKFDFADNNTGLLPLFIRTMQNNFGNCISDISFVKYGGRIFFVCRDGGRLFKLEVGFYGYAYSDINVSGERYRVGVMGGVKKEGDGMRFLLEIIFPEMPNTRRIEMKETDDGSMEFLFSETPGGRVADTFLNEVVKSGAKASFIAGIAERGLSEGFLSGKLSDLFTPRLIGARAGSPNHDLILDGEREKLRRRKEARKKLESLLARRFDTDGEDNSDIGLPERLLGALEKFFDRVRKKKN